MDVPIAIYAPDQPPIGNFCRALNNVLSETELAYGPMLELQTVTGALTARCQGFASFRATDGTVRTFAGDATKLYRQTTTTWTDATRTVGGAYTITSENFWTFIVYGDLAIAVNGADAPQKFDITSATNFSALAGTPPTALHAAVWGNYVVLGNLSTANNKIQWSGTDDPESWTVGVANSDERTFPDSGKIVGLTGGRQKLVLLENAIWRATEVGGTDIFQLTEISTDRGCAASWSIAAYQDLVFFLSRDGFFMLSDAGILPIGEQLVDNTFWETVNKEQIHRVVATVEPEHKRYRVCYPSTESGDGTCDRMLVYNWATKRWTPSDAYSVEYIGRVKTATGLTLEDLNSPYPSLDAMTISLDSPAFASTDEEALSAFDTAHKLGFFDGSTLQATIPSPEAQLISGAKAKIIKVRPLVEAGDADTTKIKTSLGVRKNKLNDVQQFTAEVSQRTRGHSPFATKRTKGRFHMARTRIDAGTDWTAFQGWDFEAIPAGVR